MTSTCGSDSSPVDLHTYSALKHRNRSKYRARRTLRIVSFFLVAAVLVIVLAYSGVFASLGQMPPPNDNQQMAMHIHPRLEISIDNHKVAIPANVGITSAIWKDHSIDRYGMTGMAPLHTHDSSGVIHVESAVIGNYTLGQFFDVWGVQFNQSCIMDKCSTG
ncbi:MAG: hypothetical protein HYY68_05945, partial [Thaumarchaeota archaeon]|nr:hypothetical protein [Nitrososphaerota archaeon]